MLERTINWLLIGNVRYALKRDNKIAFENFKMSFDNAIKDIKEVDYKNYTINKLIEEIEREIKWQNLSDEKLWLDFIKEIKELVI